MALQPWAINCIRTEKSAVCHLLCHHSHILQIIGYVISNVCFKIWISFTLLDCWDKNEPAFRKVTLQDSDD